MFGNSLLNDRAQSFSPAGSAGSVMPAKFHRSRWPQCLSTLAVALLLCGITVAQSNGNAGSITGTVTDATGALVPNGVLSNISYVKGVHNVKAGVSYQQTFLNENDTVGIVDPTLVRSIAPSCLDARGNPIPGIPCAILTPHDLTTGGTPFLFHGHTDVKQLSLYLQDAITKRNWSFNLGIRGDVYNGLTTASQAEPRVGISYNLQKTNTVLRVSYARAMETPFNENLVIASEGCSIPFLAALVPPSGVACNLGAIQAGMRNEFHAGLQQAFGKYLMIDGEYIWKYTHNGYDFGVVGSTPIAFPIEWHNSEIPGWALRASVPVTHGFTALAVMSRVAAPFFLPQVAGLPIIHPPSTGVFRIDHDELFNTTVHLQYQHRGSADRGSASTGATTADSWGAQRRATTRSPQRAPEPRPPSVDCLPSI